MNTLYQFQLYLQSLPQQPSSITVKNYLSDIRHFMNWYEKSFHKEFYAPDLTPEVVTLYRKTYGSSISENGHEIFGTSLSHKSLKRHLSTLRKFSVFLLEHELVSNTILPEDKPVEVEDIWQREAFKRYLSESTNSHLTIKNYISDINSFISWCGDSLKQEKGLVSDHQVLESLSLLDLASFQNSQRITFGLSESSINRKLSSTRKYLQFLGKDGGKAEIPQTQNEEYLLQDIINYNSELPIRQYSHFIPLKLIQIGLDQYTKLEKGVASLFSSGIDSKLLNESGRRVARRGGPPSSARRNEDVGWGSGATGPVGGLNPRPLFTNTYNRSITTPPVPSSFFGKLAHHAKHTRPSWYHTYHSYSVTHYFHMALLILCAGIAGTAAYQSYYSPQDNQSYAAESSRLIPFQGRISSAKGNTINQDQSITFSIYSDPIKNDHTLLWQETQTNVKTKPDGTFTTLLGSASPMPDSIFRDNDNLYLGVRIGSDQELMPRKQIASLGYSLDSATLSNMLPITDSSAPNQNAIVALDSAGNITLNGDGDHKFQSAGGDLSLSGQTLSLTTTPGSDGNIAISPDGAGSIDLQKPLVNTTDNGLINPGAVEVNDSFAVNASNELDPAVMINSTGTGDLLVASSSGSTKFVVSNSGNVGIGTDIPNLPLTVRGSASVSDRLGVGTLLPVGNLDVRGELSLFSGNKDFSVHVSKGSASDSAQIKFQDNFNTKAAVGLITNDKLSLRVSDEAGNWRDGVVVDNANGNVGIGTTNTSDKLRVAGNIVPNQNGSYNLGSADLHFSRLYVNEIIGASTGTQGFWQRNGTAITPTTVTDAMLLGSSVESSALVKLSGTPDASSWITGGKLGIGTTAPLYGFDVLGNNDTGSTARITNSNVSSNADLLVLKVGAALPGTDNRYISFVDGNDNPIGRIQGNGSGGVSYETTGSDFAEYFKKDNPDEQMDVGDLVCIGLTGGITRCSTTQTRLVGIVSGQAGFVGNSKNANDSTYALVGLLGQLPVKTIDDSSIKPGDALTFSEIPGKAKRATTAGMIIGKVLGRTQTQSAQIALNPTWFDPDMYLSSGGDVTISATSDRTAVYEGDIESQESRIMNQEYKAQQNGQILSRIGDFSELVAAKIKTGLVQTENAVVKQTLVAKNIVTDNLTIQGQPLDKYIAAQIHNSSFLIHDSNFISPVAEINQIHTNVISPLDGNSVAINLPSNQNGSTEAARLNITSDDKTVASIDSSGNASFSGQLNADSLQTQTAAISGDATVSGTLHAGNIKADDISGLNDQIATLMQDNLKAIRESKSSPDFSDAPSIPSSQSSLTADFAVIQQGFVSFGPATFNQASVMDSFSVGTDWTFQNHAINVIGDDLQIQPLRQGGVSFLAGLVSIDKDGTMTVQGDLHVKGTLFAENSRTNKLQAGIIAPLDNKDVVVQLGDKNSASDSASFVINNSENDASRSAVLSINPQGDLESSGSATISKLNLRIAGQAYAVSDTESIATGSAGMAKVKAYRPEVTIYTPYVTKDSLIYITPVGNTNNNSVYLLRQTPQQSFTVGLSKTTNVDIPFNWIIIN